MVSKTSFGLSFFRRHQAELGSILLLITECIRYNTKGVKLLLNFSTEFLALIYNFICEIIKLPWQHSIRFNVKMVANF